MNSSIQTTDDTLPDKLSELLALALDEADKLDRELYQPTCYYWHEFILGSERCSLCLAGFVIAGVLSGHAKINLKPPDFNNVTRQKLRALEAVREGNFGEALMETGQIPESARGEAQNMVWSREGDSCVELMMNSSRFSDWEDFEEFKFHARKVVTLLKILGY